MKRKGLRSSLLVAFVFAHLGSVFALQATPQRRADTAIINNWYRDALASIGDDAKRADDLINKAWKMAIDIAYDQGIADGYYYTGYAYERRGALDIARRYFERAVSLYSQGHFMGNLPDCYRRLGEIYMLEYRHYTALQHFLSGIRIAEDQKNHASQIELAIQLANYHNSFSKDYAEAISILEDTERLAKANQYDSTLGPIYLQFAIGYANQREYGRALQFCRYVGETLDTLSNAGAWVKTLLIEGDIYGKTRDTARLSTVLDRAGALLGTLEDDRLETMYRLLRATELYRLGDYERAWQACETLDSRLRPVVGQLDERHGLRALQVKILYAQGELSRADSLFDDYQYSKDSLQAAQYIGQGVEMSENYKLEKFERQIKEQNLQLSNTNYQRYGLIAGILVLLTILGILYFHFREKDKLAHRVALKNAEISVQNEILKQANRQNELLLREIHHRVKNNLQIINSLLSLQSRKTNQPEVVEMMQESTSRIHSIALVHNKLYEQQSINRLNVQDYIEQLGAHLLSIYNVGKKAIRLDVDAHDVSLDIDTAIPIGLILTELMTNSLKHAFDGRAAGEIQVHMTHENDLDYELIFADNGVGIPEGKRKQTGDTLGFRLINSLTRQLAGAMQYTFDGLSVYHIRFKGQP